MIKAIIFDFGGTIDSDGYHWSEKFWEVYQAFNIPVVKTDFNKAYVSAEKQILQYISPETTFQKTLYLQILFQLKYLSEHKLLPDNINVQATAQSLSAKCYNDVNENIKIVSGYLKKFKNKYLLGLVSNFYGNMNCVLDEFDLRKYFDSIVDSQIIKISKPNPLIFKAAIDQLKVLEEETVVVGDSYDRDIEPAKKLGCKTIWLDGKSWTRPEKTELADVIIHSFKELEDKLTSF